MELMDISLDKFYKFIYGTLGTFIPEDILGKITVAVSKLSKQTYLLFAYKCCLLITFANSSDPDPNCLTVWYSWKKFLKKLILKKKSAENEKSLQNYPVD